MTYLSISLDIVSIDVILFNTRLITSTSTRILTPSIIDVVNDIKHTRFSYGK